MKYRIWNKVDIVRRCQQCNSYEASNGDVLPNAQEKAGVHYINTYLSRHCLNEGIASPLGREIMSKVVTRRGTTLRERCD